MTRRQHILEEAARLFREKGYKATSMRDIAVAVGIEPSSLYNHIQSKEELLRTICFHCGEQFLDGIGHIATTDQDAHGKVRELIQLHVRIAREDVTSATVFNDEWRHLGEPHLTAFVEMRKDYERVCLEILQSGMEEGSLQRMDPTIALHSILGAMQWLYRSRIVQAGSIQHMSNQIANLLMHGLKRSVPGET
jgi:AcrR family transcriptional regulator